ncbi:MAG: DUF6513 domain-containing protein [Gemmataceae bacterium]|nr:DUF6513 domain-containing protein [Gemmataceae bacterium]
MARVLFVTGKLAEAALRRQLAELAPRLPFECDVAVLPITVVALATTPWIARHLTPPQGIDRVILPGLCQGELDVFRTCWGAVPVERGPKDVRDLPEHFGQRRGPPPGYGGYDIQIIAEINSAPRWSRAELLAQAQQLRTDGADLIDLGCDPGSTWSDVGAAVAALRDAGLRVSIDSFNPSEVEKAVRAGAELVLSVNQTNCAAAADWGCEVVAVPDRPEQVESLEPTLERLVADGVPFRIDPILEPIGLGFAASLGRYLEARRRWPNAEMMMGVGNLTELTDVDSAGLNVALLGFCQELGIRSVLTTQVINWCRTCVRELDLARRLVYWACRERTPPKHLEPRLVMLRDPRLPKPDPQRFAELAERLTDRNYRLFAEEDRLHVVSAGLHLDDDNPFALFARLMEREPIDAAHAFYLGYELAKATTALTLGKSYVQDQALRWGMLTREERAAHEQQS